MQLTAGAIAYSTFLWWFSTGIIFFLNARPAHTFRWSMAGGTIVLAAALYGLWASAGSDTIGSAFLAFSCGLAIWGWHTMSYYMGVITGPRREPCPENCSGGRRFLLALQTSVYHELAIVITAAVLAWMTWGQPNTVGLWTFVLLWGMHVSAKLNVFFGVRNLNTEFIPERLAYLTTYFRQKPLNLLFPFSVTAGTALTAMLSLQALAPGADAAMTTGSILLATLMALAVIEHWFMVLPIPAEALWRWSLQRSRGERSTGKPTTRPRAADPANASSESIKRVSAQTPSASV